MRTFLAAAAALVMLLASFSSTGFASADPVVAPPFIDHTQWVHWGDLTSLRVYPTPAGREAAGQVHNAQGDEAWGEVLALSPDAGTPGMRAQFLCHWTYAEFAQAGKTSWNLEPWRPVVDGEAMIAAGCNPGGTEEPF